MNKRMTKEELIAENGQIVEMVARQYLNNGLELEQMIEEGNKVLEIAAERYAAISRHSFSSYAESCVRKRILEALAIEQRKRDSQNHGPQPSYDSEISKAIDFDICGADSLLDDQEKRIINYTYGISNRPVMLLDEISEMLGIPRERVRQIRENAIRRLRAKGTKKQTV